MKEILVKIVKTKLKTSCLGEGVFLVLLRCLALLCSTHTQLHKHSPWVQLCLEAMAGVAMQFVIVPCIFLGMQLHFLKYSTAQTCHCLHLIATFLREDFKMLRFKFFNLEV